VGRALAAVDGQMAKQVPHSLVEPAAELLDDLMNRVTVRARIAAVLDQGHFRIGRPEYVIAGHIDHRIEMGRFRVSHDGRSLYHDLFGLLAMHPACLQGKVPGAP
jgi:hypothetical protein